MFDLTHFRRRKELVDTLLNPVLVKDFFTGYLFNELGMCIRADILE